MPEPTGARRYTPDLLTELFRNPLEPAYAQAAARRAEVGPAAPWRRSAARGVTVVVVALVGFLLAVAYRYALADEPASSRARAGLIEQINTRQATNDALQDNAVRLREAVARQRDAALTGSDAARLRDLEAATGLARVRGDGAVVRVADAPPKVDAVTGAGGQDLDRVLDRDLQEIANALWSAGAEAIAINGQRLTATSTIRAAGSAILVDFRPVTSPYEVTAVGPGDLDRRFAASATAGLLRELVRTYGMSYQVKKVSNITLPGALEPQLHYARPADEPSPTSSGAQPSTTASGGGR